MAKKEVKIPVNQMVKEYTIATLKRLGVAAETGKVYNQLKERGTVEPKTNSETRRLAKMLAKEIPTFLPNHVPIDKKKKREYVIFNAEWKAKIEGLITDDTFTPIYLRDEVDKVLREKGYNGCCTRNHLIWWLSLKGADHMTPEEIAEGIMGHDYEDWSLFRLVEKDAYHPRLEIPDELFYQHIEKQSADGNNSDTADAQRKKSLRFSPLTSEQQRERQTYIDDFLDKVEFIYEMDGKAVDQKTVDELKNDLDVLKEFRKWRDAPLTTAQYEEKYEELRDQLKTAPPRKKKRGAAKKKATDVASPVFPTLPTNTIEISEVQSGDEQTETEEVIEHSANESTEQPSVGEQTTDSSEQDHADVFSAENEYTESNDAQHEPEQWELNQMELTDYINEFTSNDETGKNKIKEVKDYIDAFCKFKDFDAEFDDLKRSVDDYQKRFKGGYIAGIIKNKVMQHESNDEQQ